MIEHNHGHSHGHAAEPATEPAMANKEVELGYVYLSNALRISFVVLKIIMVVLIVSFLCSGITTIGPDERALVLRFGKIRGTGEARVLGPGIQWVWPYPINEVIRIPAEKKINLSLNRFWYYLRPGEQIPEGPAGSGYVPQTLNPLTDGYCIVRGERQEGGDATGSDYNLLHCRWELTYQITDPERFFKNVYVETGRLLAGQNYADVIERSITPVLENLFADAVVSTMVNYTIEEAIFERRAAVTEHVTRALQTNLDQTQSGVKAISVQLKDTTWPRQVDGAFQAAQKATEVKGKTISDAKLYAERSLNEAAGPIGRQLIVSLHDANADSKESEYLWEQLAGAAQEQIAQARTYRTTVVEDAKADAEYLRRILPEYRKRPQLVMQRIYQDAIEEVLENADEKTIIQPGRSAGEEIRILINRDPSLKPK